VKLLFAIMCCNARADLADAPRTTWASECDYKIFYGRGQHPLQQDEVGLDCGDEYAETAFKLQEMCRWALGHDYDGMFKVDDDTYCRPERILDAGYERYDFVGRLLPANAVHPYVYPRGGCGYYLSRRAMEFIVAAPPPEPYKVTITFPEGETACRDLGEDHWVGRILLEAGVDLVDDLRLKCPCADFGRKYNPDPVDWIPQAPAKGNDTMTACEFFGAHMYPIHKHWRESYESVLGTA
jgi:hypothetical protein